VDDDTARLFDAVRKSGGIAIPHTLATRQGNDWRDTDAQTQPVAEIYQGARASYESLGKRQAHRHNRQFQPWLHSPFVRVRLQRQSLAGGVDRSNSKTQNLRIY